MTGRGDDAHIDERDGADPLVRLDLAATGLFVAVQLVATVVARGPVLATAVIVSLVLFALGCAAFMYGFLAAVGRSRDEPVTLGGLVLLQGTAPAPVRRALFAALGVQVVVAVGTAAIRPFTPVAFGILVPMLGVGLMASWAGRFGDFTGAAARASTPAAADEGDDEAVRPGAPATGRRARAAPDEDLDDFDRLFSGRKRRRSRPGDGEAPEEH